MHIINQMAIPVLVVVEPHMVAALVVLDIMGTIPEVAALSASFGVRVVPSHLQIRVICNA